MRPHSPRVSGPATNVASFGSLVSVLGRQVQGPLFMGSFISAARYYNFDNAVFRTSGQFENLQSLPFAASFTAANMVAGQDVLVTTHAVTISPGPLYVPITTITLLPQTINGAVTAVSTSGGFTSYTVTLASYDLIPNLAVQPGQTTLLTDPSQVVVYVDGNTQQLNTTPLAVGSVGRFNGLLFNDDGTLRMDCGQINDGVPE
jgi:hypothetical protein